MDFRPASRSQAKPLLGLYAESGAGKTWSSLLLARGFVGPNGKIGMIETEGGRGEAYVDRKPVGQYLVYSIREVFSPQAYGQAIAAAESAKLDALIIDSASHEWEGAGGVLAMAAANQSAGKKGVLVWQQPKIDHARHFMLKLMQSPIGLVVVNMRAKYPMEQARNNKGEMEWVRSTKLEPKQSEDILYEMMVHGWIDAAHNLHVTKTTLPELAEVFKDGKPISIETGRALAQWARGESSQQAAHPTVDQPAAETPVHSTAAGVDTSSAPSPPGEAPNQAAPDASLSGAAVAIEGAIERLKLLDADLERAALKGTMRLQEVWRNLSTADKKTLKAALDRRHKPVAQEVDKKAAT